jgi:hypothetical protein
MEPAAVAANTLRTCLPACKYQSSRHSRSRCSLLAGGRDRERRSCSNLQAESEGPFPQANLTLDGKTDEVQDRMAAEQRADMVEGQAGWEYADAVNLCLHQGRVKAEDKAWRDELFVKVVMPLKQLRESMHRPLGD